MKAKLIKTENGYGLEDVEIIAFYSSKRPEHKHYKLSKQNCDSLFGVFDLDDESNYFAYNQSGDDCSEEFAEFAYKSGFNKAMELNKDKLFTEDDLRLAMHFGKFGEVNGQTTTIGFIQSLQQPTEIEVEIVMETIIGFFDYKELRKQPKLDSSGNLILKKI